MIPISVAHPPVNTAQKTYLQSTVSVADDTLFVESNTLVSPNDYVVVGKIGADRSEILQVDTLNSTDEFSVLTDAIFDHPVNDPVQIIRYNKIKVFSATSEDGAYSELAGSPFDIAIERSATVINDDAGTVNTWYKIQYYNSFTTASSDESDAIQGGGAKRNSVRELIDMVRFHTDLQDDNVVTDAQIISLFNECVDDIERTEGYRGQESSVMIESEQDEMEYEMPDDLITIRNVYLKRDTAYWYPEEVDTEELDRSFWGTSSSMTPEKWSTWGDNLVFSEAFSDGDTEIHMRYYSRIPYVDSDNDIIKSENHRIFTAYACMMISMSMQNKDKAGFWSGEYGRCKVQLVRGHRHTRSRTGFTKTKRPGIRQTQRQLKDITIS